MKLWRHIESGQVVSSLGGFGVLYVDPPWSYDDAKPRGGAEHHYRTMSLEELRALPVEALAAENCALFMWATWPLLPDALALGACWGFRFKTCAFVWVKRNPKACSPFIGLGRWSRGNTEVCLLFTRGKPARVDASVRQLVECETLDAVRGAHSAKPHEVRERIAKLMGPDIPAIELFARARAPGWECWGNEVSSTVTLSENE